MTTPASWEDERAALVAEIERLQAVVAFKEQEAADRLTQCDDAYAKRDAYRARLDKVREVIDTLGKIANLVADVDPDSTKTIHAVCVDLRQALDGEAQG
jgi:hypothetical protein